MEDISVYFAVLNFFTNLQFQLFVLFILYPIFFVSDDYSVRTHGKEPTT